MAPHPLQLVRAATRDYVRAKAAREAAIIDAKRVGTSTVRELATAADLSVSRVKQIAVGNAASGATLPPVAEVDLILDPAHGDTDDHDRVFALGTASPWCERWDSEHDFLSADSRRVGGNQSDVAQEIYDLEPTTQWTVTYIAMTHEVYAVGSPASPWSLDERRPGLDPVTRGSLSGPCVLLGHAFSSDILEAGLGYATHNLRYRPGGLAWICGRLRVLNRLMATTARGTTGITGNPTIVWEYLASLPPMERPR